MKASRAVLYAVLWAAALSLAFAADESAFDDELAREGGSTPKPTSGPSGGSNPTPKPTSGPSGGSNPTPKPTDPGNCHASWPANINATDPGRHARCHHVYNTSEVPSGHLCCDAEAPKLLNAFDTSGLGVTGSIKDCPDGKLNSRGFYMEETIENDGGSSIVPSSAKDTNMHCAKNLANGKLKRIGGCRSWDPEYKGLASTPNVMMCSQLSCVPGKEKFVCSKMIGGHVHGTPPEYGFVLAKRTTCWRNGPGLPMWCSVYKMGRCLKVVDPTTHKPYFTGWSHTSRLDADEQMRGGALVTATNKFLSRVSRLLWHNDNDLPESYDCTTNSSATEMVVRFMASS